MSLPLLAAIVLIGLALGYRFYGGFVARQYALDPGAETPAQPSIPSAKRQAPQAERPMARPVEPRQPGPKLEPDRSPVATAPRAPTPASQPARATSPDSDSDAPAPARPAANRPR